MRFWGLCVILCLEAFHSASAKQPRQLREDHCGFVGSVGCKSSSCHGGAGPKRDQFITWTRQDFHARAFAVLINARSARIAETLGASAAPESARCTVCHSPFQSVPASHRVSGAHADEGVSCESCHGSAESWLRGHTRPDWNYRTRIAAGMRDLRNLYVRANACVACHQNLETDILKAGHPALTFELDSQSVAQPKHWRDEEPWAGPRAWLTGQAVALREISWALASEPQPDEFVVAQWNGAAWICAKSAAALSALPFVNTPAATASASDFSQSQSEADVLARRAVDVSWSASSVQGLLTALASTDGDFADRATPSAAHAQRAKRLVLALDRITLALGESSGVPPKFKAEIDLLFQDVRTLDGFDPGRFADHLQGLRLALTQGGR